MRNAPSILSDRRIFQGRLLYLRLDRTELLESRILETYPENKFPVRRALEEMCKHGLLAMSETPNADRLYAVTTIGQNQCVACRR